MEDRDIHKTRVEEQETCSEDTTNLQSEQENKTEAGGVTDNMSPGDSSASDDWETLYKDLNESHLRLRAEFDNYRKRTLKEKAELIRSGGESAITALLPVVDDMQRAVENIKAASDPQAVAEGVELIYNKFTAYLSSQGVKEIPAVGLPFDTEAMDAIAAIPVPEEKLKGCVVDCVQTGYRLQDKIIRHAKVVVGE